MNQLNRTELAVVGRLQISGAASQNNISSNLAGNAVNNYAQMPRQPYSAMSTQHQQFQNNNSMINTSQAQNLIQPQNYPMTNSSGIGFGGQAQDDLSPLADTVSGGFGGHYQPQNNNQTFTSTGGGATGNQNKFNFYLLNSSNQQARLKKNIQGQTVKGRDISFSEVGQMQLQDVSQSRVKSLERVYLSKHPGNNQRATANSLGLGGAPQMNAQIQRQIAPSQIYKKRAGTLRSNTLHTANTIGA